MGRPGWSSADGRFPGASPSPLSILSSKVSGRGCSSSLVAWGPCRSPRVLQGVLFVQLHTRWREWRPRSQPLPRRLAARMSALTTFLNCVCETLMSIQAKRSCDWNTPSGNILRASPPKPRATNSRARRSKLLGVSATVTGLLAQSKFDCGPSVSWQV